MRSNAAGKFLRGRGFLRCRRPTAPLLLRHGMPASTGLSRLSANATVADGIATIRPVRPAAVLRALRRSKGGVVTVTEDEIAPATRALGRLGLFVEPTAATAGAALTRLLRDRVVAADETTIAVLTGHGLKAAERIGDLAGRRRHLSMSTARTSAVRSAAFEQRICFAQRRPALLDRYATKGWVNRHRQGRHRRPSAASLRANTHAPGNADRRAPLPPTRRSRSRRPCRRAARAIPRRSRSDFCRDLAARAGGIGAIVAPCRVEPDRVAEIRPESVFERRRGEQPPIRGAVEVVARAPPVTNSPPGRGHMPAASPLPSAQYMKVNRLSAMATSSLRPRRWGRAAPAREGC